MHSHYNSKVYIMSTSDKICTDSCKDSDDVCDVNDMLQNMSTVDNEVNDTSVCANCGKEGANNECNKCNMVKYCNAVCKKVHKKKHKKQCKEYIKLATEKHNEELRLAAELHDEKLFKEPPSQHGDCPICFLLIPNLNNGWRYQSCCGKMICIGCIHAPLYDNQGNKVDNDKCPYCRTPDPISEEESNERGRILLEKDNAIAIYDKGCNYFNCTDGCKQDYKKALELYHRSGELGHAMAYSNIGYAYAYGKGVKEDVKKAYHYYELSAMMGNERARYNLATMELNVDNMDRALKHFKIAARGGNVNSLEVIKDLYKDGYATNEDYANALRAYQEYLGEIKSPQRDEAATAQEDYRYY